MILNSENVTAVFTDCLYKDNENADYIMVCGVVTDVRLHRGRLDQHKTDIKDMLSQLPPTFQKDIGGGWSFLHANETANGVQWTGFHAVQEQLLLLGMGVGFVSECVSRQFWPQMPGGMPYYVIEF